MPWQSHCAGGGVVSDPRTAVFAAPILCANGLVPSTTPLIDTPPLHRFETGQRTQSARTAFAAAALALMCCFAVEAAAKTKASPPIRVEYVPPVDPAQHSIYQQSKQLRVLEYVQDLLGAIRLPRPLTLRLTGCDGIANAWSDGSSITVCYEYVAEFVNNAPQRETPAGISRQDAILGPLLDVFLHEAGHAVFQLLNIPLFGREEDAADQFSTYIMLQYDKDRARRLILGSAYQYRLDVKEPQVTLALKKFSDEHGTPAQRFYNVLCLAYGSDRTLFADLVKQKYLPEERAAGCEAEYSQVEFAFRTLIGPYVDKARAKRALERRLKNSAVQR